ncbi:sensor histidine kinase [Catellatospora tritici]|uniref:sensor histidine kinase n=1 Tax=Catellatospora tritici TaxID=2851566 RepID=UPI001C2CD05E|nr:sensor domain-containing protein [Catellatospora tritici]MBV1852701.1 sensor domain-containing protein [Catellatospora tritici]
MTPTVRRLGADTVYVVVSMLLSVPTLVFALVGFSVGVGTVVLAGVGLLVLAGTLMVARGLADLERLRAARVLDRPLPRPHYRASEPTDSTIRRLLTPLRDGQSWLDLLWSVLQYPLAVIGFTLTVTWWAGALGGLTFWFWSRWLPDGPDQHGLAELIGLGDSLAAERWLQFAIGTALALSLPWVVRGSALLTARPAATLLSDLADTRIQLVRSRAQTRAAVSAEATALRRLERDIHDGPQQRLVRLALDLGRARQQLDADPERVRETLDEAIEFTRETLDELRTLSRGIAPPILADRGLASALTAVASRCPVPVALRLDENLAAGGRLPDAVETGVYFAVAEALTNVAKHSGAGIASVTVAADGATVVASVIDDGRGGAHMSKGHGLAGLADRIEALGGHMTVDSPAGGPTTLRWELPCE